MPNLKGIKATLRADFSRKNVWGTINSLLKENDNLKNELVELQGPDPNPPPETPLQSFTVALPPILGFYWLDGPWHCLRLEERTRGFLRPIPWINAQGKAVLRQHRDTQAWMNWISKIALKLNLQPLVGSIRLVFRPGLSNTFVAWRNVPERQPDLLHPMDPDNAVKPTIDALQNNFLRRDEEPFTGAFFNDTQIVDLLVFRGEQEQKAMIDRIALTVARRKRLKQRKEISNIQ
jgi:hypothetical protein